MQSYITGAPMTTLGSRPMSYSAASSFPATAYTTQAPTFSTISSAATTAASFPVMRPATYTTQAPVSTPISGLSTITSKPATYATVGAAGRPMTYPANTVVSGTRSALPITTGTTQFLQPQVTQMAPQPAVTQVITQPQPAMTQVVAQPRVATVLSGSMPAPTTYIGGSTVTMGSSNLLTAGRVVSSGIVQPVAQQVVQVQPTQMQAQVLAETVQPVIETVVGPDGQVMMAEANIVTDVVQTAGGQVEMVQTMVEGQVEGVEPQIEQPGPPRVVIVCTSADCMGDKPTGAWSEEITGPYYVFTEAGCEVYIASIMGGKVPIDEGSLSENFFTENDRRFHQEEGLGQFLDESLALGNISPEAIDCVWLAGGHGTCMDFEANLAQFVTDAVAMGRPVGAVCHGVIGLLSAVEQDGTPLLAGKQVTGFSNAEEDQVGLFDKVPFLVQQRMEELQAAYSCGEPWTEYAVRDGKIITGQNPQSSVRAAQLCIEAMMQP